MKFLWNHKIKLLAATFILFIASIFQLLNAKIFFDTERIIDDIAKESQISKIADDENLIFFGLSFKDSLNYSDFIKIQTLNNKIKNHPSINNVKSIFDEKALNLNSIKEYQNSKFNEDSFSNNFINDNKNKLFLLIEAEKKLDTDSIEQLMKYLYEIDIPKIEFERFISGRIASEYYIKGKVITEFIVLTILSALLCCFLLYLLTTNVKLIFMIITSVIFSIVITITFSSVIYGGIEMIMIISPAILFIVCISDAMHFTTNQKKYIENKYLFFKDRINKIGKAILLTSITTSISFMTFLFNDVIPIARFGLITAFGILLTLLIVTIVYAIAIEYNFNQSKQVKLFKKITNTIIHFSLQKKSIFFHFSMISLFVCGIYSLTQLKIDNYLTDEVNENSKMYKEVQFFDKFFGGIKPIQFKLSKTSDNEGLINDFKDELIKEGFTIDLTNYKIANQFINLPILNQFSNDYIFVCRIGDIGSRKTKEKIEHLKTKYSSDFKIEISGIGHLFDTTSHGLTKQLIIGLIIAICSIGIIFYFLTGFNYKYIFISMIPNIVPIVFSLGVLQFFNFYFSLSNAFIFTIVFGLIVDDSIHIISAYIRRKKNQSKDNLLLNDIVKTTGKAIVKTTFVVICCLLPLLLSEFQSISQLASITIISACFAVVFDLIYLPKFINKYDN